jgi:fused signal recognition particle receptor
MDEERDEQKSGWWGSTLSKLKTALVRTKSNLVDPVLEDEVSAETQSAGGSPTVASSEQVPGAAQMSQPPQPAVATRTAPRPAVPIDEDYLEEMEEKLIRADLGLATAELLVEHLRKGAKSKGWNSHDVEAFLKSEFSAMLATASDCALKFTPAKLNIYLVVGVNGTGKTTSIGKLAWRCKQDNKKVLMAAADTFRAAAESQLEIWSDRAGVEIVRLADGADPGAVVYQAIQKAKTEGFEVLVIDTAGRLHNKANLMDELRKVRNVIEKNAPDAVLESLLVLDASTGQNGLQQAKVFTEVCPLTGVILTKLDGTAKGGVVFSIAKELNIPVKLIGLGEKIDDLRDFEPGLFVEALFQR